MNPSSLTSRSTNFLEANTSNLNLNHSTTFWNTNHHQNNCSDEMMEVSSGLPHV